MKKVKKENRRKCRFTTFSKKLCPVFLAAIASLFPWQSEPVRADLVKTGANWVLNSDDPNPYKSTIGDGPGTPTGQPYTLTINPDATAFPTGNKPAISVNDDWTINIYGTVRNHANSGNGLWNAGPNTIESHSNTLITVNKDGQILATGNASNGEAVNFIGISNTLINYGLVQSRTGAAIWFQDTIVSQSNSNTVDNYGTVSTLKGSGSSAIGNSGNNGVVFINRTGALVDGGLSFAGGSDQLTFEAGSKVTGAINGGGGDGRNDLTLQGAAGSNDSLAGAIQNFTTLTKDGQGTWTITGSLTGFTIVSIEEGTLRLTGNNTDYNGSVIINSAGSHPDAVLEAKARSLPTTGSNVGNIKNDGVLRFVDSRSDNDGGIGSYAGQIIGSGLVEMTGDGVVTLLNTNNTYEGGTYVKNGTLNVISDATLGATNGKIVLGDAAMATTGTLQFGAAFDLASSRAIQLAGSGGVIDTHGFSSTISQGITGDPGSAFTKAGAGTLILTGNNTYSGGTYITGGTLQVGTGGTAGSIPYNGIISITGATAALAISHSDPVTISTRITGAGKFIQRGTGTTTLTGINTYSGGTDIENGTLAVSSNVNLGSGGPLTFGTTTTNGTLRMNGNVDLSSRAISLNVGGGTIDTQGFRGSSSGVITGSGGLTKTGSGMLTLTGNSTYTGGTTISGGAIQLGNGGTSGSIVGDVANNGSLIFNRSDDVNSLALSGVISGSGNLIQRGSGTTTLSGGNSYSGGTIIENGTLAVNSDTALGAATGSLTFGTATTNGTLKLTADIDNLAKERNVTLQNGGGTIDTGGYHGTTGANIQGTGHFTKTGDGTLTLTADNDFTGGTTVSGGELKLGDGGTSGSVIGNVLVETTDSTVVYNRSDESTDPAGTVSGAGNVIQRGSGVTTITNTNTYTGSTTLENGTLAISEDANLGNGGAVIFDGGTLRLNADLTDFNPTRSVMLKSDGTIDTLGNTGTIGSVIDGSGTLTKAGTGTLFLTGENTYSGDTTVAAGILSIGNGGATGSIVGNVANSGTLIFHRDGTVTYPGVISGTGKVIQQGGTSGTGTTIFTGNSTYTGGTEIVSGTLQLGDGGTSGNIVGNVTDNGTLAFNRSDSFVFSGTVSGSGNLVQKGTGTTILTGTNTYTGGTLISDGALQLGNCGDSGSITGNVVDNGILIFSRSDDQTFSGVISGTGSVVKQCTNILTLDVANTFTGGTTLKQGDIVMAHENALGSTNGVGELAGHVRYDAANDGNELIVYVDSSIRSLKNHFHVNTSSKITSKNVFQIDDDLTFSEITNKNTTDQKLGGAFYVGAGSKLAINVGRTGHDNIDLVFSDNKYGTTANDIYLGAYGILNLNISGDENNTSSGNAVFINSGIDSVGSGSLYIEGAVTGTGRQGLLQIAADSRAPETTVTGAVLRLVNGVTFSNSIYNQGFATILQGNGIVDVSGSALPGSITIAGTLSPDAATFTKGDDVVAMTKRFATLTLTGGKTEMKNFTFRYDVAGPSASHKNDLVMFGSQDVSIEGGVIDFITLSGTALNTGQYLVFDSDAANYTDKDGTALTDATLDTVLSGKINGVAMTAGTPRIGYDFNFNNDPAQNQIWLGVNRNTLQVVWQGGNNYWTPGHWKSVQHRSSVYAENFNNGDLAIFENDKGNAIVTLGDNIIVSGLQLTKVFDSVVHITINGDYGISARKTDASIEGEYAKTDGSAAPNTQEFNTTGKLEIFGVYNNENETMTTLTLDNTGKNEFLEGIDIHGGKIALETVGRLGNYDAGTGNAGLVTFKVRPNTEVQKHVVEVNAVQTLQNRFVVEGTVKNAFIIANENTTISDITSAAAIELLDGSSLTLQANGPADIILTGNEVDVKIGHAQLIVDGTGNTFVKSGIQGEISTTPDTTGSWLTKNGAGTLQIEADSDADFTWVADGIFRVRSGITYGLSTSASFELFSNGSGTVAGDGTIQAQSVVINKKITPDKLDAADATKGSRYGTLTLTATGTSPSISLSGFSLDFDVTTPTVLSGGKPTNAQDLLVLNGATVDIDESLTAKSAVYFNTVGGSMKRGDYLVIQSESGFTPIDIDGILGNGPLEAYINGRKAPTPGSTPRGTVHFRYNNSANTDSNNNIWLVSSLNSLTMDWTGTGTTTAPVDGNWNYTDGIVSSRQQIPVSGTPTSERQFLDGDKMHISSPNAMTVTLEYASGTAFLPTVSGLVAGRDCGNNDRNGDVTITGKGGITADKDSAFGAYVDIGGSDDLSPTGKLQKYGTGTLTVANTGGNRFLAGTELYNGKIVIGHEKALGEVDGTGTNLDGYVFFTGIDNVARTIEVADTVTSITNHFRAVSTAGANVFKVDNALTISGVVNDNASTSFGGAFYVGNGSNLTIDADADLMLSGNSANSVSNDIYAEGTLNFDVAAGKGVFVGSGLAGNDTVNVNGAGFVQVAANSFYEGTTNVNSGGTLRVVSKSISDVYGSSVHTFNQKAGSNLEGNGRVYVETALINGNLSPDGMTKTSGTDTVSGADRYAVLSIVGDESWATATTLDGFTFDYDAKAPNTGNGSNTPNDLLLISGMQTINLGTVDQPGTVGTVNFRTDTKNNVTTLGTGKYLIVDTDYSGAGISINMAWNGATSPDDVLAGKLNGTAFGQLSPRNWYSFRFNNTATEASTTNSQIWLDVTLNSLTMDWTGSAGTGVWNTTDGNWNSLQTSGDGNTRETQFRNGDFVHFSGDSDYRVELGTDVLVSGLVGGRNSGGTIGTGNVTITGAGIITSDATSAFGDYVNKTATPLTPTGKLEKFGPGTLTIANTGGNFFKQGTLIKQGTIVVGHEKALGVFTGSFSADGTVTFDANADAKTVSIASNVTNVKNRFIVKGTNNTLETLGDVVISDIDSGAAGGVIYLAGNAATDLTIDAKDGNFTFNNNKEMNPDNAYNDIRVDGNSTLNLTGGHHIFLNSGISGAAVGVNDPTVNIIGTGDALTQVGQLNDFNGVTNITSGGLRVWKGYMYGGSSNKTVTVEGASSTATASLEGDGIVLTNEFTAGAYSVISPDDYDLSDTGTPRNEIGTLKIQGTNVATSTATLNGFTMDYDTDKPDINTWGNGGIDPDLANNDLLRFIDMNTVTITGGTINFRGPLTSGDYLIVDANTGIDTDGKPIDGIDDPNGVLKATYNGNAISNDTPRSTSQFELRDYNNVTDSQIWYTVDRNTLTMERTQGGDWNSTETAALWTSAQSGLNGKKEHVIERGDYAKIYNTNGGSFTITGSDTQTLSGMQLGETGDNGDVIIAGNFGIRTVTSDVWIEGDYISLPLDAPDRVPVDGKLTKNGDHTATFTNTGGNLFEQGIELYAGTLSFNRADQLYVGGQGITGKVLAFKGDAALRADATTELNTDVVVDNGVTGTFHADYGNAMLLQNSVSGDGNLAKTGEGIVQLGVTSTIGGDADLLDGAFRVVDNTIFTANEIIVAGPASLQGGGTVTGSAITVNGHLSPDKATLTTANIDVPDAQKFGTLTLNATEIYLDDFTMDYDLGTPNPTTPPSGNTPTGDLLQINGNTTLTSGLIAFLGTLNTGNYLIVDSDSVIDIGTAELDGISHIDGILAASLNGNVLTSDTPRNELLFKFENDQKQIWLEAEVNTLFVDWTGGTASWGSTAWTSRQQTLSGGRDDTFRDGDRVAFLDGTQDSHATLTSDVIVGGLDVNTDKNVTIDGDHEIRATKSDPAMIGEFVKTDGSADPTQQQFNTTGELRKEGNGVLAFRNKANTFEEGVFLGGGTTTFDKAAQLGDGGKGIEFYRNSTLRPDASMELGNAIRGKDNVTATFDTADGITLDFVGNMTGTINSVFAKTSGGTMNLRTDSTGFEGAIDVASGTLGVYANYGNSKSFIIRNGATLTGTGTIGGGQTGVIESGGTLYPNGYTPESSTVTYLTVNGNLTFDAGSNFNVTISQDPTQTAPDGKMLPVSDYVKVDGGDVAIDTGANLNVEIDYWGGAITINDFNEEESSKFTVIDAADGSVEDEAAQFTLNLSETLPRGVKIIQGWQNYENGWMNFGEGWLYQLWFENDPTHDFEHLCDRHNRVEIGKNLDQLVLEADPALKDLIMHLSSRCFTDQEVCQLLDQLTGDLRANSLMMAMKTPWRSPFSRLDSASCLSSCADPCSGVKKGPHQFQLWGEWTARYDDVRSDRNAHPYTINRMGVTVGADRRISHRTTLGLAFNYSDPRLRQATGKAEMDDYEIGLYGRTRLNGDWMLKYYAGYSRQRYDIRRNVSIPACEQDGFAALNEHFRNKTDGDSLAMSVELIRAFRIRENFRLLPTLAFDFNQAWQKGYRESGGVTALEYQKTSLERMMMRFGLGSDYAVRNNIDLKARIQYATQLNSHEQPRSGVRFANATIADQRTADIWGTRIGRDYLNLGIGMDWQPNRFRDVTLFINYDADLYKRATVHAGQFGLMRQW